MDMKTFKNILLALFVISVAYSCQKAEPQARLYGEPVDMEAYKKKAVGMVSDLPKMEVYDHVNDRVITVDFFTKSFSFATPNSGWNYSDDDDLTYVPNNGAGGVLYVGPGSLGSNTGGTVVAGNTILDITYTFCVSVSSEALGLDLFFEEEEFDGFSIVMGIAGDFEALQEGELDEDADFTDFFQGIAWYYIYDNEAQGNYTVLDWFEDLDDDPDTFSDNGFACAIGMENFDVYFSTSGSINVSGGDMTFTGEYFGLLNLYNSFFDDDYDSIDAAIVDGYGTMGCE